MLTIKKNDIGTNLANFRNASSFFPSLYLLIVLVLFGIVFKIGFSKISEQRKTLSDIKAREAILADKESELSKAKNDIVGIFYNQASVALPESNPILLSFSQTKSLLDFYLLPLDEYTVAPGGESEDQTVVNSSGFKLSVVGKLDQIISFLKDLESLSPIMSVSRLTFSAEKDALLVEMTVNSFWSPFAAKVQVDTPIQKITNSERNTLVDLGKLKQPTVSNPSPSGPFQRSDPFSSSL